MRHSDVRRLLQDSAWEYPMEKRIKSKALYEIFSDKQSGPDPDKVKCSCSESLGLFGLLRFFFESRAGAVGDRAEVRSFRATCHVLDLILATKRQLRPVNELAPLVKVAASDALRLHKDQGRR